MKERFQNPNCGDLVKLRLFSFSSNEKKNVHEIEKVEIIYLDENKITESNPNGEVLIRTIPPELIQNPEVGEYYFELFLDPKLEIESDTDSDADKPFVIGKYIDRWHIQFEENENCSKNKINNFFQIYPSIWFTSSGPTVHEFDFNFRPNKIPKGSKRYISIEVKPITPAIDSIETYYKAIAVVGNLKINIKKTCSNCSEENEEEEIIVEDQLIEFREQNLGYYLLDTDDLEEGIYDVWFKLEYGGLVYISEKNQISIFN